MIGMLTWKEPRKREKPVTLREQTVLHIRFCRAEPRRGPKTPEAVLRRRVRDAAKRLRKAGVSRVVLPEAFDWASQLELLGLQPVSTLPLRRAMAADWVRWSLKRRGISPAGARVAVVGKGITGELARTVTELALRHRYVLLAVDYGGEELDRRLRREYGVSLLLNPPAERLREADAALLFDPRVGLEGAGTLALYDESVPLPPLSLPPALEDALPPGVNREQLLTALLEGGALRPGQMAFQEGEV